MYKKTVQVLFSFMKQCGRRPVVVCRNKKDCEERYRASACTDLSKIDKSAKHALARQAKRRQATNPCNSAACEHMDYVGMRLDVQIRALWKLAAASVRRGTKVPQPPESSSQQEWKLIPSHFQKMTTEACRTGAITSTESRAGAVGGKQSSTHGPVRPWDPSCTSQYGVSELPCPNVVLTTRCEHTTQERTRRKQSNLNTLLEHGLPQTR